MALVDCRVQVGGLRDLIVNSGRDWIEITMHLPFPFCILCVCSRFYSRSSFYLSLWEGCSHTVWGCSRTESITLPAGGHQWPSTWSCREIDYSIAIGKECVKGAHERQKQTLLRIMVPLSKCVIHTPAAVSWETCPPASQRALRHGWLIVCIQNQYSLLSIVIDPVLGLPDTSWQKKWHCKKRHGVSDKNASDNGVQRTASPLTCSMRARYCNNNMILFGHLIDFCVHDIRGRTVLGRRIYNDHC